MQYARMLSIFKIALPVAWTATLWAETDVLAGQVPAVVGTFVALVATLASLAALIVWAVARIAEMTERNRAAILANRARVARTIAAAAPPGSDHAYWVAFADIAEDLLSPRGDDPKAE